MCSLQTSCRADGKRGKAGIAALKRLAVENPAAARGLGVLDFAAMELTEDGAWPQVVDALAHFPGLVYVSFSMNRIGVDEAALLASVLPRLPSLRDINLSGCELTDPALAALSLGGCPTLESVAAPSNFITATGVVSLAAAGRLRSLNLSGNPLGEAGAFAVAKALAGWPRLAELRLSQADLAPVGVVALVQALRAAPPWLEILKLDGNDVGRGGGMELAALLATGCQPRLQGLSLHRCALDGAAPDLLRALAATPHMMCLSLWDNEIDDVGADALAAVLRAGALPRLGEIDLSMNRLSDAAAARLVDALLARGAVPCLLHLSGNPLSAAAQAALAAQLARLPPRPKPASGVDVEWVRFHV